MWKIQSFNPTTNEIITQHAKGKILKFRIPEKADKKEYVETLMEIHKIKESRLVLSLYSVILLQAVIIGLCVIKLH